MINVVIGVAFGDEGKGAVTSTLSKKHNADLVVRFNGGHQAGHTVVQDGVRHVFSNFGSGSLSGVPTYWSRFCTLSPTSVLNERDVLIEKGIDPILYIDPMTMITTPFDLKHNRKVEEDKQHGSVGVGFGATIQRNEDYYTLRAMDLEYPSVLIMKLDEIMNYYEYDSGDIKVRADFIKDVEEMLSTKNIIIGKPQFNIMNPIFEGAQGLMLDQHFGIFPHVTRSNTGMKNVKEVVKDLDLDYNDVVVNYITRTYLTRHGNGALPFEDWKICENGLKNTENETNVYNKWQGHFRYAPMNLDLIRYAINHDMIDSGICSNNLWITCADQVDDTINVILDGKRKQIDVDFIEIPQMSLNYHYNDLNEEIIKK